MYLILKPNPLQMLGDEVNDVYNALRKLRNREIAVSYTHLDVYKRQEKLR